MTSVPDEEECPVDTLLKNFGESFFPLFRHLKLTANDLTTLSLLFGILSVIFLWKRKIALFGLFYFISYFFDAIDGSYARKYHFVSKFGDYYDHIKDVIIGILLLSVFIRNYRHCGKRVLFPIILLLIIFTVLMGLFIGCQAKKYRNGDSSSIEFLKKICPPSFEKNLSILRFFGSGSWVLFFIACVFILESQTSR